MFNSPALDIAIGLVFIFLLYSLLATSIQEAVATGLSLRATMLRKSIVENMLSDTPAMGKCKAVCVGIWCMIRATLVALGILPKEERVTLGQKFYDHPLIKNYGESRMFPLPSYIPRDNFSAVLVDILLQDFRDNVTKIAEAKIRDGFNEGQAETEHILRLLPDAHKIREALAYHIKCYGDDVSHSYYLPCETCRILEMHLRNSYYELHNFCTRLESWFDDSMRRVTGWYKRKVQFILFVIGLVIAFFFNVDTIEIAGRLSTDKDARDKLVQMAVKASEGYKDDPRVQQLSDSARTRKLSNDEEADLKRLRIQYDRHMEEARKTINGDISVASNILSVGWKGFGEFDKSYVRHIRKDSCWWYVDFAASWKKSQAKDSVKLLTRNVRLDTIAVMDSMRLKTMQYALARTSSPFAARKMGVQREKAELAMKSYRKEVGARLDSIQTAAYFSELRKSHPIAMRIRYMAWSMSSQKFLGFLILAFGICLGAPFWFDMLNKLVMLRGAGKKETGDNTPKITPGAPPASPQPLQVTVNNQQSGEEAVG